MIKIEAKYSLVSVTVLVCCAKIIKHRFKPNFDMPSPRPAFRTLFWFVHNVVKSALLMYAWGPWLDSVMKEVTIT